MYEVYIDIRTSRGVDLDVVRRLACVRAYVGRGVGVSADTYQGLSWPGDSVILRLVGVCRVIAVVALQCSIMYRE